MGLLREAGSCCILNGNKHTAACQSPKMKTESKVMTGTKVMSYADEDRMFWWWSRPSLVDLLHSWATRTAGCCAACGHAASAGEAAWHAAGHTALCTCTARSRHVSSLYPPTSMEALPENAGTNGGHNIAPRTGTQPVSMTSTGGSTPREPCRIYTYIAEKP